MPFIHYGRIHDYKEANGNIIEFNLGKKFNKYIQNKFVAIVFELVPVTKL